MILSMTGFGRGTAVRNGREITVELRSVNSRYFEYSSRMPRTCSYMDSRLKKQLNEQITRGKVELSLTVQNVDAADTVVTVNRELARSYQQALRDLSEELCIKNQIKRMFGVYGAGVNALHRDAIGGLALDPALAPGQWRELSDAEVAEITG
mgnify:CR=1 FL=1